MPKYVRTDIPWLYLGISAMPLSYAHQLITQDLGLACIQNDSWHLRVAETDCASRSISTLYDGNYDSCLPMRTFGVAQDLLVIVTNKIYILEPVLSRPILAMFC